MSSSNSVPSVKIQAIATLKALQLLLKQLSKATCQINLVKSMAKPNAANTRLLDGTIGLSGEFKSTTAANLLDVIANCLSTADGVVDFDFQPFADGRIAVFSLDRFDQIEDWFSLFPPDSTVQPLTQGDEHARLMKFTHTAMTWAPKGETLRLICKSSDSRLTKKGSVIARMVSGSVYDLVDPEQTLMLDMHADFFVMDDIVFVVNYKRFEQILDFRLITQGIAQKVCAQVFTLLPVTDQDAVSKALMAGARNTNRLARVYTKAHLPKLDMKRIAKVIQVGNLPIKIVNLKGVETLHIDAADPVHVKAYLHILSDDYVSSMVTDINYIGLEKDLL